MKQANVSVKVSTKNRYDILSLCLMSIANQTVLPKEILIYDDGECRDLRQDFIYKGIFDIFNLKEIKWKVLKGRGLTYNHHDSISKAQYEWVYRVDDDNVLAPDTLERLLVHTKDEKVGAVASAVIHPDFLFPITATSTKIADVGSKYAAQFSAFPGTKEVEHLYSTFLYKRKAAKNCYPLYLSPQVAHREDSIFSHEIKRAGWKLIVDGDAVTYHIRAPRGGIRSEGNKKEFWDADEALFKGKLKEWGVKENEYIYMLNAHALGDNYIMKSILPEIRAKFPNKKLMIGTLFGGVYFDEPDVEIVDFNTIILLTQKTPDDFDPYKLGYDTSSTDSMKNLYRKVYNLI